MSVNFDFLNQCSRSLVDIAGLAENYFATDPNTCTVKLRQFGEQLCHYITAQIGLITNARDEFKDLIDMLQNRRALDQQAIDILHRLRKAGNIAAHQVKGDSTTALGHLRMAHQLAIAVYRAFKDPSFKPSAFIPPPDPDKKNKELTKQIDLLNHQLKASLATTQDQARKLSEVEQKALAYQMDLSEAQAKAKEVEELLETERKKLAELETQSSKNSEFEIRQRIKKIYEASGRIELDELQTRLLIDKQLIDVGWEANTTTLTYKQGARPQVGRNMAIAEWPVEKGFADYVLFVGLKVMAIVEAKRESIDAYSAIEQSKRYSKAYVVQDNETLIDGQWDSYKVPFLFATNGRSYLKENSTKSGICFLDARRKQNHPTALPVWYSPEGLIDLLKQDIDKATQTLKTSALDYLPLRYYQKEAIEAVENALANEQKRILIAMATGTGKTQTAISLLYRLVKAGRFRRVLFLVDREALGEQATTALKHLHLEGNRTFANVYDVKGIGDTKLERDTRLQVATVQSLVKRIFYPNDNILAADQYDCIVVDECHRGYILDQHMTDVELSFRDEKDYISKYSRVLEHFDAVKIGLTATPALHTVEIFNRPVYQYTYRQAVIDGYLIDHEPPIRLTTELAKKGIKWAAGEPIKRIDKDGKVDLVTLPDEVKMDIDQFNNQVVTENFNRVICDYLASEIDPNLEEKTLIFCVRDDHADMLVKLLKEALDKQHGSIDDDTIAKITSAADKPLEKIKRYKNELMPNIAVTVDLLTTGIDVPKITNLVFIRRVKSRILYEQMLGRATRLCPEIKKERFRVFDAVDLYSILQEHTSMKPVVAKPNISFEQLVQDLKQVKKLEDKKEVLEQLIVKFQRKCRKLENNRLEAFESLTGTTPDNLLKDLQKELRANNPDAVIAWFDSHKELPMFLDEVKSVATKMIISEHEDKLLSVDQGFGNTSRPEDYLESFASFIKENLNQIPALILVTQRPRDLTRQQLKELKFELDKAGFNEKYLETAWRNMTNQEIAASIIGFIRNKALGSPLVPYKERVDRAVKKIMSSRAWTQPQRKCLENIAKQIKQETLIDREYFDQVPAFQNIGGYKQVNKALDGQLDQVLSDIFDALWQDSA